MKIILNKSRLNLNPEFFLRRAGYGQIDDRKMGKISYARRLTRDFYPRLHMYYEERPDRVIFDLHLDQKRPSYEGVRMHNAEHEGPVVEGEIERLKALLAQMAAEEGSGGFSGQVADGADWEKEIAETLKPEEKIGHGDFKKDADSGEKKGFFRKLLGF